MTPEEAQQALQQSTIRIADLITNLVKEVQEKKMPAHKALALLDGFIERAKALAATYDPTNCPTAF